MPATSTSPVAALLGLVRVRLPDVVPLVKLNPPAPARWTGAGSATQDWDTAMEVAGRRLLVWTLVPETATVSFQAAKVPVAPIPSMVPRLSNSRNDTLSMR